MITQETPVAILVRVSTEKQETNRQISELQAYADARGYRVVEILTETISGRADEGDRHGLRQAEELARNGSIEKVLVHEISRLARKNSIAHKFVENLEDAGVSLYWHAQGIETLLPNGKRNPAAGIMLALLSEMARSEVEVLRERIKSGLAEARRKGIRLGRRPGTKLPPQDLIQKHPDIVRNLRKGQSVRNTRKITGKGYSTVQRVKAVLSRSSDSRLSACLP
jgi:DNA invertase Pin-like site-specific DNA recombinase